ncbi:MAG: GNVR domain-containing protein [bacterium]
MAEEVNILDYWRVIKNHRRLIIGGTFLVGLVAAVVSLLLPRIYLAEASILPPAKENRAGLLSALSALPIGSQMLPLMGQSGIGGYYLPILRSQTVAVQIIKELGLMDKYEAENMEEAVKHLEKASRITQDKEGLIRIAVQAKSALLAARIANTYIKALQDYIDQNTIFEARQNRIFIEGQLTETEKELHQAEDALKAFQEGKGTVSISEEVTEAIKAAAELKARMAALEVQVGVMSSYTSPDHPDVVKKRLEIQELSKQYGLLEHGGQDRSGVPLANVPAVGLEFARLKREVIVQETLFKLLSEEYERAKISEAKEAPQVQILDSAVPPEKKYKPKVVLNIFIALITGLFLTTFLAFFREYLRRIKQ